MPTAFIQMERGPKYGSYKYGKARENRFPGSSVCLHAIGKEHSKRMGSLFL
jgi:hypothetical protein